MKGPGLIGWATLALVVVFLLGFLAAPLGLVLAEGLKPAYLREVFANPVYRAGLGNALLIALTTTLITVSFTVPLAWRGARVRFAGKGFAEAMLLAPLVLPPFVGAIGVYQLLGQFGVVNTALEHLGLCEPGRGPDWLGHHRFAIVCVVEALGLYPVLYLLLADAFGRVDPTLLEAARGLGAGRWTVFRRVVLPLARPALFAGTVIIFVWSFTELGTPLMLGFQRTLPVQAFNGINDLGSNPMPFALVVVMLGVATGLYLLSRLLFSSRFDAMVAKGGGAGAGPGAVTVSGWRAALAWLPYLAVVTLALIPHFAVILTGFSRQWYRTVLPEGATLEHARAALSDPLVVPGIVNSVEYSTGATVLCVALGLFIAWVGVRWKPRGWQALDVAAMVPLAVPGIIFAFGYLGLSSAFPWLKSLLDPVRDPTLLLIIAYGIRRLPYAVRAASSGLAQTPVAYEEAAAVLGAGRATRLRRVTLPLIAGSLAAAALMVFSASMLEVSDSLILAQKREFWPITRVIYDLTTSLSPYPAIACAFAAWAMLFLTATLAAAAAFLGKSPTALFKK